MLQDAELRAAARADFERRRQGRSYTSPLSPEQEHPTGVPEWMLTDASLDTTAELAAHVEQA